MRDRLGRLRQLLDESKVDALITGFAVNRRYISGFTGSAGYAIVTSTQAVMITDFRYVEQVREQAPDFRVVDSNRREKETMQQVLSELGVKRLAFEQDHISFATYTQWQESLPGIELVPVTGLIEQLRMIKDESELAHVRRAVQIVDDAFRHIITYIKPGIRESDVALELEFFMRKQGAEGSAFDMIVASGVRGALPHGRASDKLIEAGELVTLDYGALYQGYASDITRTVAVGEPSAELKKVYQIVLDAQIACVSQIKPGMTGHEADALTRDPITSAGYGEAFGHSTGHGLGLEVHENPRLGMNSTTVLKPGMLVTVEPGIYLPGLGGVRIEDDIWMTEEGCEILTQSTKELLILPV